MDFVCRLLDRLLIKINIRRIFTFYVFLYCYIVRVVLILVIGFYFIEKLNDYIYIFYSGYFVDVFSSKLSILFLLLVMSLFGRDLILC